MHLFFLNQDSSYYRLCNVFFNIFLSRAAFADNPLAVIPATFYVRSIDYIISRVHTLAFSHSLTMSPFLYFIQIALMGFIFGYYFLLIVSIPRRDVCVTMDASIYLYI